jgi:hypothetical protein
LVKLTPHCRDYIASNECLKIVFKLEADNAQLASRVAASSSVFRTSFRTLDRSWKVILLIIALGMGAVTYRAVENARIPLFPRIAVGVTVFVLLLVSFWKSTGLEKGIPRNLHVQVAERCVDNTVSGLDFLSGRVEELVASIVECPDPELVALLSDFVPSAIDGINTLPSGLPRTVLRARRADVNFCQERARELKAKVESSLEKLALPRPPPLLPADLQILFDLYGLKDPSKDQ